MRQSNLFFLFLLISGISTFLKADDISLDFSDYGKEPINVINNQEANSSAGSNNDKPRPFSLNVYFDSVAPAKIDKGFYKGDEFRFTEAEAELGMVFYYCPAYSEGANIALSYTATYLHWSENPFFEQDHFNTLALSLGGITKRLENWLWRGQFDINYDIGSGFMGQYLFYDLLLWGRYSYSKNIGLHVGFLGQTGMGLDRVWPILGADWQMSKRWKINLVYPVNIALEYTLNQTWSLALAIRNFNTRHRVKKNESNSKSLIRYQNSGAELGVKYEKAGITANIHAGTTLGGDFRIANAQNNNPHHYKLRPSGYIGGEVDVKF
ncbi:MAG: hypothetical protein H0V82_02705 [Candidatus Protochlamydia sp.]|nr:hypothetical protein [Candidatus Protochlamydia sp.]